MISCGFSVGVQVLSSISVQYAVQGGIKWNFSVDFTFPRRVKTCIGGKCTSVFVLFKSKIFSLNSIFPFFQLPFFNLSSLPCIYLLYSFTLLFVSLPFIYLLSILIFFSSLCVSYFPLQAQKSYACYLSYIYTFSLVKLKRLGFRFTF